MKRKFPVIISLAILTPLGFLTKFYAGPFADWVNNSLGGVLYVVFWCLVLRLIFSLSRPITIVLIVLAATSCLEALQLWHPLWLQAIRASFLGSAILGTTFVWSDFVYYVTGAVIGYFWIMRVDKQPNEW